MKKECQYILLPTEEASNIHLEQDDVIEYYKNSLPNNKDNPQHIYILSDDKIKEGDWYFKTEGDIGFEKCDCKEEANDLTDKCKKIIATTNPELHKILVKEDEDWDDNIGAIDHSEYKDGTPSISQSDIEYIINLYNTNKEKKNLETIVTAYQTGNVSDKEINIEKLANDEYLPYQEGRVDIQTGLKREGFIKGYNRCLQDNADKKFTLEDMKKCFDGARDSKLCNNAGGTELESDWEDKYDEFEDYFKALVPNSYTVIVEYEYAAGGYVNYFIPKVKDGYIIIHKT